MAPRLEGLDGMILDARDLVTNPEGNRPQDPNLVIGLAVHYTVGQNIVQTEAEERAVIRAIDRQHVGQDFGGFGYHGITFPSGRSYYCGDGQRAHVAKRNHQLRGWALHGTFTEQLPGPAQFAGLREALTAERSRFSWLVPIKGHREWALPGEATQCPGLVVPRDWDSFLAPPVPPPMADGWVALHNQLLAVKGGEVFVAIGDWEGEHPGRIAKRFGDQWLWLRRSAEVADGTSNAYWSTEKGD